MRFASAGVLLSALRAAAYGIVHYNLLFLWFVGFGVDDAMWDHSTFSKNHDSLLDAEVAAKPLEAVLRHS